MAFCWAADLILLASIAHTKEKHSWVCALEICSWRPVWVSDLLLTNSWFLHRVADGDLLKHSRTGGNRGIFQFWSRCSEFREQYCNVLNLAFFLQDIWSVFNLKAFSLNSKQKFCTTFCTKHTHLFFSLFCHTSRAVLHLKHKTKRQKCTSYSC